MKIREQIQDDGSVIIESTYKNYKIITTIPSLVERLRIIRRILNTIKVFEMQIALPVVEKPSGIKKCFTCKVKRVIPRKFKRLNSYGIP